MPTLGQCLCFLIDRNHPRAYSDAQQPWASNDQLHLSLLFDRTPSCFGCQRNCVLQGGEMDTSVSTSSHLTQVRIVESCPEFLSRETLITLGHRAKVYLHISRQLFFTGVSTEDDFTPIWPTVQTYHCAGYSKSIINPSCILCHCHATHAKGEPNTGPMPFHNLKWKQTSPYVWQLGGAPLQVTCMIWPRIYTRLGLPSGV